jgi:Domain of unknown function (DUF4136)
MKQFITLASLAMAAVLYSCEPSIKTFSDRDTKADLNHYKTYAWIAPGDSVLNAPRKDKLFGGSIMYYSDMELKQKGMTVDTSGPDALFVFDTKLESKVEYKQAPSLNLGVGYGGPGYYVGGSAPIAGGQITASNYEEGTLVINMYDTRTGHVIWSGGARKALTGSSDVEGVIKMAVKAIFAKLPKKPEK